MVWNNAPCLKRLLSILGTSFCETILIWNYFHWIKDHSENIFGRVEDFLFSPANSFHVTRSHHVMSYCIISCHISSCIRDIFRFYLMWRACWFLPLWSGVVHTSWGQICIKSFFVKWMTTGESQFWGISLSYFLISPIT